jgi:hypothetical protein
MNIHRPKWTGLHTSMAAHAIIVANLDNTVLPVYCVSRASRHTLRILALVAHNRHTHHRMRIYGCYSYPGFLRIVYSLPVYGTSHLTNPAAGALLRHHCYLASHILLLISPTAVRHKNERTPLIVSTL